MTTNQRAGPLPENQNNTYDIAISGASFAGLALAASLRFSLGRDVRICIIDRAAAPVVTASDSRAFAIWAASKNLLQALGVWERIAVDAEPMIKIEITDSALDDGIRPTLVTYDARTASGEPAAYVVPSGVLLAELYRLVAAEKDIAWEAPAEAIGLEAGEFADTIELSDGRKISARLVVAAEGRNSKLRDAAGIKTTGWGYAQTGIVATVAFSEPHGGIAVQHFLPGGPFAILPLKDNRACITWSAASAEAERMMALDDAAFLNELDHRIGGRFGPISLSGTRQSWPLDLKMARSLVAQRFALIGDAAHGVHPIAGQGVNLGFRDVAALTECVSDAVRLGDDFGSASALERYSRWRRFDTTMSAAAYDGLNRLFSIDNFLLRAGRDAGLSLVDRIPALKTMWVEEAAGLTGDIPKLLKGGRV